MKRYLRKSLVLDSIKKRVAEAAKKLLMDKKGDAPTIENLNKIIATLLDRLHEQAKAG